MKKASQQVAEIVNGGLSPIFAYIGGVALSTGVAISNFNQFLGTLFNVTGGIIFACGIILGVLLIKKSTDRQENLKNFLITSKIESLLLDLSQLKLNLAMSGRKIENDSSLKDQFYYTLSQIEIVEEKIDFELNHKKRQK